MDKTITDIYKDAKELIINNPSLTGMDFFVSGFVIAKWGEQNLEKIFQTLKSNKDTNNGKDIEKMQLKFM